MCKSDFLVFLCMTSFASVAIVGCSREASPPKEETTEQTVVETPSIDDPEVAASLAELSAEDRSLAIAQKFCAVETENLLGKMGAPVKLMIEGEPVFLCCEGCEKEALADPAKTLASAKRLKVSHKAGQ